MVQFVLTYDLDLLRLRPLQNHILGHISVINGQNVAKINKKLLGLGPFNKSKKYFAQFECEMYSNALCWQPLCRKTSLTTTFVN